MHENDDCEPQAKGGLLLARLAYIEKVGGTRLLEKVIGELAPEDSSILRNGIRPDAWYALTLHRRLDDAIASVLSPDDRESALIHLGRISAEANLASGMGPSRDGTPERFLEALPRMYGAEHSKSCIEYMRLDRNTAAIRAFARRVAGYEDCWTLIGWLQRGFEMFGAGAVIVTETHCRADGAPYCEYRCEWS